MPAPTYSIDLSYSALVYASKILRERIDHIDARIARNPRTPNAAHLRRELDGLRETRDAMETQIEAHVVKVRASLRALVDETK